ncbi:MAG TPA: FAD-binding oxidoreductase [Pseudomonadales bacterium]|nr:FAD-binding oxidoreductase [Pseudomonadales bacterium]
MARLKVIVVGGGMAGMSCAANLAPHCDVTVLEAEDAPGYHSSGRSAASYIEPYVNRTIFTLTHASRPFFENPPAGFADAPLVTPRADLMIAAAAKAPLIDAYLARWSELCPGLVEVDAVEARRRAPLLRAAAVARAVADPNVMDIDVHGLLNGFRRMLKANGGELVTRSRVQSLARVGGRWRVDVDGRRSTCDVVVDAAGAWGDQLARRAGVEPVGLVPKRRSVVLLKSERDVSAWPMVHEVESEFYFKPDAGRLLLSPADATPSEPCDAQPDEYDLAVAVERFERATDMTVTRIEHRWAGLRSFVTDSLPVVGFEPSASGFFWLIGQGGFGIQTSPTMGRLSAALVRGEDVPSDLRERGITAAEIAPRRAALVDR